LVRGRRREINSRDILSLFKNEEEELQFKEIVSKVKEIASVDKRTIIRHLNKLVENGTLTKDRRGRNTYYRLSSLRTLIKQLVIRTFYELSEEQMKAFRIDITETKLINKRFREYEAKYIGRLLKEDFPFLIDFIVPFLRTSTYLELFPFDSKAKNEILALFDEWLLRTYEFEFASKIAESFSSKSSYREFVETVKNVYGKPSLFIFCFRPDLIISELEQQGILKKLYYKLKKVAQHDWTMETDSPSREIRRLVGIKPEYILGLKKPDKNEIAKLSMEAWKKRLNEKEKRIVELLKELRKEINSLPIGFENYVFFSLLVNSNKGIKIMKKKLRF